MKEQKHEFEIGDRIMMREGPHQGVPAIVIDLEESRVTGQLVALHVRYDSGYIATVFPWEIRRYAQVFVVKREPA